MKGEKLLKVTSILMIVFGAISVISSIVLIVGIAALVLLGVSPVLWLAGILVLISSAFELVVGIIGVANCSKPEKQQMLFALGLAILIVTLVSNILYMALSGEVSVMNLISGILFPVLFTVAAYQSKKSLGQYNAQPVNYGRPPVNGSANFTTANDPGSVPPPADNTSDKSGGGMGQV